MIKLLNEISQLLDEFHRDETRVKSESDLALGYLSDFVDYLTQVRDKLKDLFDNYL